MEIDELKVLIEQEFKHTLGDNEYKLLPIWESKRICQCGYAVIDDSGIVITFDSSANGIFQATTSEILTRVKTLEHWIAFVKGVKEQCVIAWERENGNA